MLEMLCMLPYEELQIKLHFMKKIVSKNGSNRTGRNNGIKRIANSFPRGRFF